MAEPADRGDGPTDDGDPAVRRRLETAELELVGRFADASNATLLVRLLDRDARPLEQLAADLGREPTLDDLPPEHLAVYKPARGESPLWDFPRGTLHLREVAAYELSRALGWDLVPTTVLRRDAPAGEGSLQRFVGHDPQEHYFALLEAHDAHVVEQLRDMVVFDVLANNADRKGGHVLLEHAPGGARRVRLIDHGVTFHSQRKLRTVGWHFAGEPLPERLRGDVARLARELSADLGETFARLLDPTELDALRARAETTAVRTHLPEPRGPRPTPWPLL